MCGIKTTNDKIIITNQGTLYCFDFVCELFVTNSLYIYGLIDQSYIIKYTHAIVDNPTE